MRNLKMTIQYDGSRYKGWQKNKQKVDEVTVQAKIESVLSKMVLEEVLVVGSERTAVGTHAENYTANFHTNCDLSIDAMLKYLYEYLPEDIVVKSMQEVDERFHSKYNVKSKTYVYKINNNKFRNVFDRKYVYHIAEKLSLKDMRIAAECLVGTHDFQSFNSSTNNTKSTEKTINYINITENNGIIEIEINANEFLTNMARIIIAALLEIGKGNIKRFEIEKLLNNRRAPGEIPMVKTKGLFLRDVQY